MFWFVTAAFTCCLLPAAVALRAFLCQKEVTGYTEEEISILK